MSEALETPADHLRCGDRIRRGHRVFDIDRIEVTHCSPVRLVVHRVNTDERVPASEDLELAGGEIVQRVQTDG